MECPFCAEDIKNEALVCKHCGRDLKIPRPLIEENEELIAKLELLQQEVGTLRTQLARRTNPAGYWSAQLGYYILPAVVLLLIAHYLIVVRFDLNPMILRAISIVVPIPFGFALRFLGHHDLRAAALVGVAMGVIAVLGMSAVVGVIDKVPILPDNMRDWREMIEYMASIALAVVTGNILAMALLRILPKSMSKTKQPNAMAMRFAVLLGPHIGKQALRRRAEKVEDIMNAVTAAGAAMGTAAGSVYTGIRALLPVLT